MAVHDINSLILIFNIIIIYNITNKSLPSFLHVCCSARKTPFEKIKEAIKLEDRETLQSLLEELQNIILEDDKIQKVPSLLEEDELATALFPNDIPDRDVFPLKALEMAIAYLAVYFCTFSLL